MCIVLPRLSHADMVRVVIVGAGLAGLAAATALCSADTMFQVMILEASEQVGGRTRSTQLGAHAVDLGATNVYYNRQSGDPLIEYAISKGLVEKTVEIENYDKLVNDKPTLHLLSNGERLPSEKVELYQESYYKAVKRLEKESSECNSFNTAVAHYFYSIIQSENQEGDSNPSGWAPHHILDHMLTMEGILTGSKMNQDVDVPSYGDYQDEDCHCVLKNGYQSVALSLANDLPPTCLLLNKEVTSIHWSDSAHHKDTPVTVFCQDGSTYAADHVIVTVSLGVLRKWCPQPSEMTPHTGESLFLPILPKEKRMAIHKLGYGAVSKVVLQFPKALSEEHGDLEFFWLEEDHGYPQSHPWASRQYTLERQHNTAIYYAWFAGEDAKVVDSISDQEVAEGVCLVLEKFLQRPVTRPTQIAREAWSSNPNFLGSYSFNTTGTGQAEREALSRPVDGSTPLQLLFAGEATHATLFSSVNAAYESGTREANRLLQFYLPHKYM